MSEAFFKPGDIVIAEDDDRMGVVAPDVLGTLHPDIPVVFDGTNQPVGVSGEGLVTVGEYDPRIDDTKLCGAGLGASACRYLVSTPEGDRCARFDELKTLIDHVAEERLAQAVPTALKPNCQDEILANAEELRQAS